MKTTVALKFDPETRVAVVEFDRPAGGKNVLDRAALEALDRAVETLLARDDLAGVIVRAAPGTGFIAGADVETIAALSTAEDVRDAVRTGQEVFAKLRILPVPVVAVIDGPCLGGGLELALACTYRIAVDRRDYRIGLPETQLGIVPGWGGTQRLARLIGFAKALSLLPGGRTLLPRKARALGLVDEVVPQELALTRALDVIASWDWDARMAARARRHRGVLARLAATFPVRLAIAAIAKRRATKLGRGHYPAPLMAIDAMRVGLDRGLERGLAFEQEAVATLLTGPPAETPARALQHVFFLRESHRAAYPGREPATSEAFADVPAVPAEAGVTGAGKMGGEIAALFAQHGAQRVRVKDVVPAQLNQALKTSAELLARRQRQGRLTGAQVMSMQDALSPTLEYTGFARAGVVIEAVPEDLELKRRVLADLEACTPGDAVLASNTSTLSITEIAAACDRPMRVIGLHFFSPAAKMPLVEIIPGARTNAETIERTFRLAVGLGKMPVLVADSPGFLVNRLLGPYLNEACFMLVQGIDVAHLDRALVRFGMPVGPITLMDEVGLRVGIKAAGTLAAAFPERIRLPGLAERLAHEGWLGKSAGRGFYDYPRPGRRRKNSRLREHAEACRTALGVQAVPPRSPTVDLVERLVYLMINEAAFALAEGVVPRAADVDAGMVYGTGFPPFTGGLLRHADALGAARVVEGLTRFAQDLGARYTPAPVLRELAEASQTFYQRFGD